MVYKKILHVGHAGFAGKVTSAILKSHFNPKIFSSQLLPFYRVSDFIKSIKWERDLLVLITDQDLCSSDFYNLRENKINYKLFSEGVEAYNSKNENIFYSEFVPAKNINKKIIKSNLGFSLANCAEIIEHNLTKNKNWKNALKSFNHFGFFSSRPSSNDCYILSENKFVSVFYISHVKYMSYIIQNSEKDLVICVYEYCNQFHVSFRSKNYAFNLFPMIRQLKKQKYNISGSNFSAGLSLSEFYILKTVDLIENNIKYIEENLYGY